MTLIDQRILIDAPPHVVWDYISDPAKIAHWHAGYTGISVLTTQRAGVGTRRRCTRTGGGRDIIEEITAWVEGLGYEYRVLEGEPYRNFQGRVRLQSVPDGTIVQWTVSYDPKNLLGVLRDRMSGRQEVAAVIATSLRQLRRMVDELGVRLDEHYRARVGIQPRLNAVERAQYQRRHPPADTGELEAAVAAEPVRPAPETRAAFADDPAAALSEELTDARFRPPAAVQSTTPLPLAPLTPVDPNETEGAPTTPKSPFARPEPDLPLPDVILPPADSAPSEPIPQAPAPLPAASSQPDAPADAPPPTQEEEPDWKRSTPPRGLPAVQVVTEPSTASHSEFNPRSAPAASGNEPAPPPQRPAPPDPSAPVADQPGVLPPQTPKTDTGDLSIWDVFGMERPSTQDAHALQDLLRTVYGVEDAVAPRGIVRQRMAAVRQRRGSGLRVRLMLQAARVRLGVSAAELLASIQ